MMAGKRQGKRSILTLLCVAFAIFAVAGCSNLDVLQDTLTAFTSNTGGALSMEKIAAGLKEALRVGTQKAVAKTSAEGGYANNPRIRIPMPEKLDNLATKLRNVGLGSYVDRFEGKMNQSAEKAAVQATPVFLKAVTDMSFADAKAILQGESNAATEYFRSKTSDTLRTKYRPIVTQQMESLGTIKLFNDLQAKYNRFSIGPKANVSVEDYVTDKALDGLFKMLADEEKKIRENPAARTTELLKAVFGKQQ